MATNKFATMLHRNTNKITLVLVYAMLEWILIILLLLNSLFSYVIIKFVDYFGLKRPCIWCTRIDHIIEPENNKCSCRDLVCEAHAFEISKLGFCLNHRKLAESETMCVGCSSSCHPNFVNLSQTWMPQMGMIHDADDDNNKVLENGVEPLRCSCCGVNYVSKFYLIRDKPSLRVLDCTQKQNLITESGVESEIDEGHHHSDHGGDDFILDHLEEERNTVENKGSDIIVFDDDEGSGGGGKGANDVNICSVCDGAKETVCGEKYTFYLGIGKGQEETIREESLSVPKDVRSCEVITHQVACTSENTEQIPPKHLDFVIHGNDFFLIPVEFGDSFATERENQHMYMVGDDGLSGDEDVILDFDMNSGVEPEPVIENWHTFEDTVSVSSGPGCIKAFEAYGAESIPLRIRGKSLELIVEKESLEQKYQEVKFAQTTVDTGINGNVETNMKRYGELCSAVSQVATQMQGDELEAEVSTQYQDILEDSSQQIQVPSSITTTFTVQDDRENLYQLHKKLQLLGGRESRTEELLEGSVISDIECDELTIEKLKSALKAERKALSALYAELEEERSASAVAANQTMAMINRLQEEKAAMQMEALQYERMMEEQSEYDREALQLLNELMIKREKENFELEKELEIYQKKVHEYEVREKIMSRRESNIRSKTCPSCSNARDSDGLSIDFSQDTKEENGTYSHQEFSNRNTPEDAVIYLEESLANFEEERLLILEQLKMLEEKIAILNYEEEYFDGNKSIENLCEENGNGYQDHNDHIGHVNGLSNGKHHDGRKTMCTKAKRVLPLFDATGTEAENRAMSSELDFTSLQNSSDEKVQLEKKKLDVEVEMDHVYERLLALEADREFLKHCISSLGKGDKGLDLIQEILQHLRDLRNVEQRIRNMGDIAV
ncbi:myosin-binding protein 3 [Cajanus cajan]|uniref:myosin-binding protein 3 n=1 Tax=Cajanus cajan TaxID=3821 RepID=UPI00098D8E0F|nr:myosin-binding protein 3 [Cajanus cajan]